MGCFYPGQMLRTIWERTLSGCYTHHHRRRGGRMAPGIAPVPQKKSGIEIRAGLFNLVQTDVFVGPTRQFSAMLGKILRHHP